MSKTTKVAVGVVVVAVAGLGVMRWLLPSGEVPQSALAATEEKAGESPAAAESTSAAARRAAIERGAAYLIAQQKADGSWGDEKAAVGVTGLCAQALLAGGKTLADEPVRKAVAFLAKAQQSDGGIYDDGGVANYTTSIAVMVLAKADRQAYAEPIRKAVAYLTQHQWDETESVDKADARYGGAGYGKHERPDLSNTQFFADALQAAGVPKDDPAWARMVIFVSRSQARSESNDGKFVGTDDGGMIYTPYGGGESKAGDVDLPDGRKGLKSYGSMTYAGFKTFLYADVSRDDPRVLAALDWIRRHWTFEENPELGQQGLYYYYHTVAKALQAWGEAQVLDARRQPHDWRAELTEAILRRQKDDGSWINANDRWFEGMPLVPTSEAIMALSSCE